AKISYNNKNLYGLNKTFTAKIFDVDNNNYERINTIEMNRFENFVLFNEDLFCSKSDKFINSFTQFFYSHFWMLSNL
ncbi:hypothetical protein MXB_2939, partial [Myxobolus squamalis]